MLTVVAAALVLNPAAAFTVSWKVSVIGNFKQTDKFDRECFANLNHVYTGSTKVVRFGTGFMPETKDEISKMGAARYQQENKNYITYKEVGTPSKISFKINSTFGWSRVKSGQSGELEGYDGTMDGAGVSMPTSSVFLYMNNATSDCRLYIRFNDLRGASPIKLEFESFSNRQGERVIVGKSDGSYDARNSGQGVSMTEDGPNIAYIKAKGFNGLKGTNAARFRMFDSDAEVPIKIQIEADVKKAPR